MASGPACMICASRLVFGCTEGIGSRFHVLHFQNRFRRYRGHRVPFTCFAPPDIISAVPIASSPVFMFCTPGLVFGGTEGVGTRFHIFCARTKFRRYRERRIRFSCFARPNYFSALPRASGSVYMFCAPELIFDGTEGVGSRFHVLRAGIIFGGMRASVLIFMFYAPGVVFGGSEGVGSRFHVLRAHTRFRRYRGRRVPFSCFARTNSFSTVTRASGSVFVFCTPGHIFGGTKGVGSRFHVLRARTHFRRCRVRRVPFSCFSRSFTFSAYRGCGSRFHVLSARTYFRRYLGRRDPFSCFARPFSFLAVPRAWGPVFMFCAPGLVFGGIEGVWSRFHVLRAWTHFRRYRGCRVKFLCFVRPDSFSAVPRASDSVRAMNRPKTHTRSTIKSQLEDTLTSRQDKRGDKLNSR
jgi:hypothetical protein